MFGNPTRAEKIDLKLSFRKLSALKILHQIMYPETSTHFHRIRDGGGAALTTLLIKRPKNDSVIYV